MQILSLGQFPTHFSTVNTLDTPELQWFVELRHFAFLPFLELTDRLAT